MSPDQKGIETVASKVVDAIAAFTMSPDQKGIETRLLGFEKPKRLGSQ